MKTIEKNIQKLFREAYKYDAFINELSEYQIQKLIVFTDKKINSLSNTIGEMIRHNPDYNYPDGTDESKLFEYWADRLNTGEYWDLNKFKMRLIQKIKSQELKLSDNLTLEEKFKRINESELSRLEIAKFIEAETEGKQIELNALLTDLNLFALDTIIPDVLKKFDTSKSKVIDKKLDQKGYESFEEGWDVVLGVLEPFKHSNLVMLKELTEEKVKASVKNLSGNNRTDTVDEDQRKLLEKVEREVRRTTSKDSAKYSFEVMFGYMKAHILNQELTAEACREYCVKETDDPVLKDKFREVDSKIFYTWRKKVKRIKNNL